MKSINIILLALFVISSSDASEEIPEETSEARSSTEATQSTQTTTELPKVKWFRVLTKEESEKRQRREAERREAQMDKLPLPIVVKILTCEDQVVTNETVREIPARRSKYDICKIWEEEINPYDLFIVKKESQEIPSGENFYIDLVKMSAESVKISKENPLSLTLSKTKSYVAGLARELAHTEFRPRNHHAFFSVYLRDAPQPVPTDTEVTLSRSNLQDFINAGLSYDEKVKVVSPVDDETVVTGVWYRCILATDATPETAFLATQIYKMSPASGLSTIARPWKTESEKIVKQWFQENIKNIVPESDHIEFHSGSWKIVVKTKISNLTPFEILKAINKGVDELVEIYRGETKICEFMFPGGKFDDVLPQTLIITRARDDLFEFERRYEPNDSTESYYNGKMIFNSRSMHSAILPSFILNLCRDVFPKIDSEIA